mmetsp:Transcript_27531/g.40462  ORF Transcript_27531/g.40462 Transcript_27531/m.40462 type:complete len:301 (-) Transcript_27531:105-1007(-)|eukprot:CAMPEP_0194070190 /NCGR_PEP_ID=MMETSP0009_2-20130614/88050_1 /TAXON_ID=210454 /ORGANISM="Grammatophora oceanica, Strain CCMP 410" /LENGTH=300 /DNA_ID=CAMNT_0038723447 /DNA_START=77 /DNA_END=979 /DNA_ORIENTATION=-
MDYLTGWFSEGEAEKLPAAVAGVDPYEGTIEPIEETETLLAESFQALETELDKITEKDNWLQAQEKCPELLDDSFKLMFLRCEKFDAKEAAERVVRYWNRRVEVFGPTNAFLPLTLDGAMSDESNKAAFSTGLLRLLVGVEDPVGRPVIFCDPSRQRPGEYERNAMVRYFWYIVHAALEQSKAGQTRGVIFVAYVKTVTMSHFDSGLVQVNLNPKGALPVHLIAFHVCYPPTIFSLAYPILKLLLGSYVKRVLVHSGTEEDVKTKMAHYGLTQDKCPTELGGLLELNQEAWLQERRENNL